MIRVRRRAATAPVNVAAVLLGQSKSAAADQSAVHSLASRMSSTEPIFRMITLEKRLVLGKVRRGISTFAAKMGQAPCGLQWTRSTYGLTLCFLKILAATPHNVGILVGKITFFANVAFQIVKGVQVFAARV